MHKLGMQVWPSPDVLGTEDRLCKVAMSNIALEDTLAYSTVEEFVAGFKTVPGFPDERLQADNVHDTGACKRPPLTPIAPSLRGL